MPRIVCTVSCTPGWCQDILTVPTSKLAYLAIVAQNIGYIYYSSVLKTDVIMNPRVVTEANRTTSSSKPQGQHQVHSAMLLISEITCKDGWKWVAIDCSKYHAVPMDFEFPLLQNTSIMLHSTGLTYQRDDAG